MSAPIAAAICLILVALAASFFGRWFDRYTRWLRGES